MDISWGWLEVQVNPSLDPPENCRQVSRAVTSQTLRSNCWCSSFLEEGNLQQLLMQATNTTPNTTPAGNGGAHTPPAKYSYDYLCKLLIIGETAVGKSCLILRYTENSFRDLFMTTIGVDFKFKYVQIEDKVCKLQIWDTAGQERFRTITSSFYRGADGIIIAFDPSMPSTYQRVEGWLREFKSLAQDDAPVVLVATKCDIPADKRAIDISVAEKFAKKLNLPFVQTSAKTGAGVNHAFELLTNAVLAKKMASPNKEENTVDLKAKKPTTSCTCSIL